MSRIIELEDNVVSLLPASRWHGPPPRSYLAARDHWTEAVWSAAMEAGPAMIEPDELQRGLALCSRVVFLCGVHRSGTTLLRDLIDGHPNLSVLPSEGSYFTGLYRLMAFMKESEASRFFVREWLGRLVNPINQAPFWLLGRTTEDSRPYTEFARRVSAWWSNLEHAATISTDVLPHTAVLLAYASVSTAGRLAESLTWLAEKTPTNEFYVDRVRRAYSGARFIHLVRHPYSIFASRKQAEKTALGEFRSERRAVEEIKRSFAIAAREATQTDFLTVRYEDLIALPWEETGRIARFLNIAHVDGMLIPTLGGKPSSANSSFGESGPAGTILGARTDHSAVLTMRERNRLANGMTELAARFGYSLT